MPRRLTETHHLLVALIVAAAAGASAQSLPQAPPASAPFTVTLPQGTGSAESFCDVFLTGPFGGNGRMGHLNDWASPVKLTSPDTYAIETATMEGVPATGLKAVIYSAAYGFALVDVPSLANHPTRTLVAPPKPPPTRVRLTGRVVWPDGDPVPSDVIIQVTWEMTWICEYFGLSDCLVDSMDVGTATLGRDNQFSVEMPDFVADPAIRQFSRKGRLSFRAESKERHDIGLYDERDPEIRIERARELISLTARKAEQPRPVPATRVAVQFPAGVLTAGVFGLIQMRGPASPSGPSWGYGALWDSEPGHMHAGARRTGPGEITIDASHDGRSAQSLKAAFYLPSYGFALIDVANLVPDATRVVGVPERAPVDRIRLAGRVILPAGVDPSSVTIDLLYLPDWKCDFFVELDCLVGPFSMGSVHLTPDATFSFDPPDFSRDPSLQPFVDRGSFYFSAMTDSTDYEFKEVSMAHRLPVSPSQASLVLTAVKRQYDPR